MTWRLSPAGGSSGAPCTDPERTAPPSLEWLGQAGFLLRLQPLPASTSVTVLIDPYLSDSLA